MSWCLFKYKKDLFIYLFISDLFTLRLLAIPSIDRRLVNNDVERMAK